MGTIIKKHTKRGEARFQAKIRRTGVPIVSKVFPSREEAEAWIQATEPELQACSPPEKKPRLGYRPPSQSYRLVPDKPLAHKPKPG